MIEQYLNQNTIQLQETIDDWQSAITLAAQPLIKNHSISNEYLQTMINSVNELGPYIIITPLVALPHARPEQGVQKMGLSLLRLKQAVAFSNDSDHLVNLVIVLAANDNSSHIGILTELSDLLGEEANVQAMIAANSSDEIITIINTQLQLT